jgi:hypothetical protein
MLGRKIKYEGQPFPSLTPIKLEEALDESGAGLALHPHSLSANRLLKFTLMPSAVKPFFDSFLALKARSVLNFRF